ncbi:fimbria/pilus outer membrane usher protein [Serratia quinivorans]|nr:fimbria/pilus outer membrane usher protein [Serratia quinivorans]MBV6693997.1 fimbria/pilus outer membrane usher protein [Serratia quinivorans]
MALTTPLSVALAVPKAAEQAETNEFDEQLLRARGKESDAAPPVDDEFDSQVLRARRKEGAAPTSDSETTFDSQLMQSRGVDPKLAELFRQAPRFLPGETRVALTVNGRARGRIKARFDSDGKLCADEEFLRQAGLLPLPKAAQENSCLDLQSAWPQTELHLDPGEARVTLVVPPQAVANTGQTEGNWKHGGFAGMLNYDAQYMGATGGLSFAQLGTEAGFNLNDWIIRSRQTFSRFNGQDSLLHQAAYAQRTFTDWQKVLQAGQINLTNSMFGTGQVLGFQMFPEAALLGGQGGAGLVEGIADSQSVVEVRQSGVLVYSTTVPAGPFRLQGFSLLNTRTDLAVTLTSVNGSKRQFIVPASMLLRRDVVAPGISFGAGRLVKQGDNSSPMLATLATGWRLTPGTLLNLGGLASSPYRATAVGLETQLFDATLLSMQTTLAQDNRHDERGGELDIALSHNLTERIGVNLSASQRTGGYRELNDALQSDEQSVETLSRRQLGAGVSWSDKSLGNLSLSWARSTSFQGFQSDYLRASWSKQLGQAYVSISLERDGGPPYREGDNRFYLAVNVPFGGRSIRSYINNSGGSSSSGVRYSDRSSQDRGWSLAAERDMRSHRTSASGTIDHVTSLGQLNAGLSRDSDGYTSWSTRATGGMVFHDHGVTLSPYRISDTFGLAKVGEEAGVRLETPSGPTWTDSRGYAVLPSLTGYRRTTVRVDTRSLAKNVDIGNAWQETEGARGSVNYVDFDVVRTRRVLVTAKDPQGKLLSYGASVFNADGKFVTVVGTNGSVFISDATMLMLLDVQVAGITQCTMTVKLPVMPEQLTGLYETAEAVCV